MANSKSGERKFKAVNPRGGMSWGLITETALLLELSEPAASFGASLLYRSFQQDAGLFTTPLDAVAPSVKIG